MVIVRAIGLATGEISKSRIFCVVYDPSGAGGITELIGIKGLCYRQGTAGNMMERCWDIYGRRDQIGHYHVSISDDSDEYSRET
jgi:hypothetical protein